MLTIRNYM